MKLSLPKNIINKEKGFTLIELLVVIGIVGILAAALLQTIDPFEQLKKGRDTVTRDTAVEFLNANTRYYASHTAFPWNNGATPPCTMAAGQPNGLALSDPSFNNTTNGCTQILVNDGELKQTFIPATTASKDDANIFVTYDASSQSLKICYAPTSKAFVKDAKTIYDKSGNVVGGSACPGTLGTCFQCVQ